MRAVETEIFDRHPGHFAKVHFSADGRFLSRSVASANQVTVWNTRSWQKIAVIPQRESGFFGNDARLATVSEPGTLTFWALADAGPTRTATVRLPAPPANEPLFSPDSRYMALSSGPAAPVVDIWDITRRKRISTLTAPEATKAGPYAFSRDGRLFATAYDNGWMRIWDTRTWSPARVLEGHSQRVVALAFSPTADLLATGSADTTVRLWTVNVQSEPTLLSGDGGVIYSLAFSPDGQTLAAGGVDGTIKFWNIRARRELATLKAHDSIVCSLAFSPDSRTLASISVDETMRLWKAPPSLKRTIVTRQPAPQARR